MLSSWFAHPALLWSLFAIPVAQVLLLYAHFRRRRTLAQLAAPLLLRKSVLVRSHLRRWKTLCVLSGLMLVGLAAAGPQWGIDRDAHLRKGRDVILVLDLSRSMDAEQPSRRELAMRHLHKLADAFEERGGNRFALIVFASQPQLLFPLTQDCDHLRHTLKRIEMDDLPKINIEEPKSGTRIGAALRLASESFDPARANRPIIVLLSDGDDPADDNEWQGGVAAAKEKRIAIHVVGIGDPSNAATIPAGDDVLRLDGQLVRTRMNEQRLRDIAKGTDGVYLPAHTGALPLGTLVLHLLDADELLEEGPSSDGLPIYQLRYAWFLLPAVFLFMLSMWLSDGPRPADITARSSTLSRPRRRKAAAVLVGTVAMLCISAADPAANDVIRQANAAFERSDFASALKLYEQAESLTVDPGLVSFNRAAAHFRLRQHKEAIECYRRCLKDDAIAPDRRARARFDLANALVELACTDPYRLTHGIAGAVVPIGLGRHPGDNPTLLAQAMAEYRACLYQANISAKLRADARHNLEIAQLLWLKAREGSPDTKTGDPNEPIYPDQPGAEQYAAVDPEKGSRVEQSDIAPPESKSDKVRSSGMIVVLPDHDRVQPIASADALATLAKHIRRIVEERRAFNNPRPEGQLTTKDW